MRSTVACLLLGLMSVSSFCSVPRPFGRSILTAGPYESPVSIHVARRSTMSSTTSLAAETNPWLSESDQAVVGVAGTLASLIVFYSEFTLKTTGCGLPAGPLGLLGAAEGVSYLAVVGLVGLSLFKKVKTGSGLPAGPGGLLGAAEGLSFLAAVAGLVVLGFQIADYGYIPNAVPMEGGMCS